MDFLSLIHKYYADNPELENLLLLHSRQVAQRALSIARKKPELNRDCEFLEEAAMLHDIGIFLTDAPGIGCHGTEPYLLHGFLGAELMRREGLPRVARVCERHTGTGLTAERIQELNLPLLRTRNTGREVDLLCRQILFQESSGERTFRGRHGAQFGKIWCGRREEVFGLGNVL